MVARRVAQRMARMMTSQHHDDITLGSITDGKKREAMTFKLESLQI